MLKVASLAAGVVSNRLEPRTAGELGELLTDPEGLIGPDFANAKTSTVRINISENQYRQALKNGLIVDQTIPNAHAGDRLRMVVQDQATGLAGTLWLSLQ